MKTQQTRLETWTCWRRLCTCFFIGIPSVESSTIFHLASSFSSNHLDTVVLPPKKSCYFGKNKIIKLPHCSHFSLEKMSGSSIQILPFHPSEDFFVRTFGSAPLLWAFHRFGCSPNLRHPHHERSHHPNPKSTSAMRGFSERGGNGRNQPEDFLAEFCPTQKKIRMRNPYGKKGFLWKESFLNSYPPQKKTTKFQWNSCDWGMFINPLTVSK